MVYVLNRRCADRGHGKRHLNLGETLRNGKTGHLCFMVEGCGRYQNSDEV